jgi:biopolymer transport protein ExbD
VKIKFVCGACGKKLKARPELAGRRMRCSGCDSVLTIPGEPAEPETSAEPEAPRLSPLDMPAAHVALPPPPPAEPQLNLRRKDLPDDGLDMTPMVDCTFLLLIFFMITAAFALQKSIELPTPDRAEGTAQQQVVEPEEDDFVIVRIDRDNTVWVNDVEAPSSHDVLARIKEARAGTSGSGTGPGKLLVEAHGDARHEVVVMVLDMGTAAGMDGISLKTIEDE